MPRRSSRFHSAPFVQARKVLLALLLLYAFGTLYSFYAPIPNPIAPIVHIIGIATPYGELQRYENFLAQENWTRAYETIQNASRRWPSDSSLQQAERRCLDRIAVKIREFARQNPDAIYNDVQSACEKGDLENFSLVLNQIKVDVLREVDPQNLKYQGLQLQVDAGRCSPRR